VRGGRSLTGTAVATTSTQRRSVRMRYVPCLVLADLPADVVVVLEQQEGAGDPHGTERALRKP
jgi:hypothetical protein